MSDPQDPLSRLWQSQPVQRIDAAQLKQLWAKNRRKQWLWLLSDALGFVVALVMCIYFLLQEENLFRQVWLWTFLILTFLITPFMFKSRYVSLASNIPTNEYLQRLIQQKINNIRIVIWSVWSLIFVALFFAIWSVSFYFYYEPAPYEFMFKLLKGTGVIVILASLLYLWGKYELRKNRSELARYRTMQVSDNED